MSIGKSEIFNAEITGAANFFSKWVDVSENGNVGFLVSHPSGPTTTYTVEVANARSTDLNVSGAATPTLTTYSGVVIPAKSAAEVFGIEIRDLGFSAARIKLANASGTGTPVITVATKD